MVGQWPRWDKIYDKERCIYGPKGRPYDPGVLVQHPVSHLAKIEYGDDYNKLDLSYRYYKTGLAGRAIHNENYQINYNLKSPDSDNIDLNVLYAYNKGTQNYNKGEKWSGMTIGEDLIPINPSSLKPYDDPHLIIKAENEGIITKNDAHTFDISNTFSNSFGEDTNLQTTIGVNILKNKYSKSRHPRELNYVARYFTRDLFSPRSNFSANTFYPAGEQKFNTFYMDNTLNLGIFTFGANINYVRSDFKGEVYEGKDKVLNTLYSLHNSAGAKIGSLYNTDEELEAAVEKKCSHLQDDDERDECENQMYDNNTKLTFDNKALGKQIEELLKTTGCRYTLPINKKPEDVEYMCDNNNLELLSDREGKRKYVNYSLAMSAYLDDLFTPFINYSKTHRAPNIKEMFFTDYKNFGVNTDLKPEQAKTWQVGFNSFKDGLISDDDVFGAKFLVYRSKIKDYIYNTHNYYKINGDSMNAIRHVNYDKYVNIKGLELELSYDSGAFYTNFAFAKQKTNQPPTFTDSSPRVDENGLDIGDKHDQGYGLTKVTILPKYYGNIDMGVRMFDKKFVVGGIMKFYGESKITGPKVEKISVGRDKNNNEHFNYVKKIITLPKQPNIFDFYAIYQPNENLTIKAEIQNFFDKKYIDPLDANSDSANQFIFTMGVGDNYSGNNYARGRTAVLSVSYKY